MDERFKKRKIRKVPLLVLLFISWAISTGFCGLFSKVFLQNTPLPVLLTVSQSLFGSIGSFLYLKTTTKGLSAVSNAVLSVESRDRFLVGALITCHYLATLTTNLGTLKLASSFLNTLKAADPLWSVWGAKYVLNQRLTKLTLLSLVLIVAGIFVACTTEFEFQMAGFLITLFSNSLFCARTIIVKKIATDAKSIDYQSIFYLISVTALFCSIIPLFVEIFYSYSLLKNISIVPLIAASLTHYLYNTIGFLLLSEVEALTYSVGHSMKRLLAIYVSLIYFRNKVSVENSIAAIVAVVGAVLYAIDRYLITSQKTISGLKVDI